MYMKLDSGFSVTDALSNYFRPSQLASTMQPVGAWRSMVTVTSDTFLNGLSAEPESGSTGS